MKFRLGLWSGTSTIHTRHQEYMYIQVVVYLLFRLQSGCSKFHHWKWTTNFKGFILHVFSLDKLQWNEKSLFSRSIQIFILATVIANEQHTNQCKLTMLCYKTKKCKSYLWPLLLLQPSYTSCKYNNWNAATSKQRKQQNTYQDYIVHLEYLIRP